MEQRNLLIVIPAYNEEKNIVSTIKNIRNIMPAVEIAVVSDGSSDKTASLAKGAGVTLLEHMINLGDGAARQTGFKYALAKGYVFLIHMDADGQHNAEDIPAILSELSESRYNIVIGSRHLGKKKYRIPVLRYCGMRLFSILASLIIGQAITDPTSGFRGIDKKAMEFYANHFYPEYYPDADVIIASHKAGLKIKEVSIKMNERKEGKSLHGGLSPFYYIYKMILSIFIALSHYSGGDECL